MNVASESAFGVHGKMGDAEMRDGLLVEELLQALSSLLDEIVIKYPIIPPEWKLPHQSFSWERWNDHLRIEQQQQQQK